MEEKVKIFLLFFFSSIFLLIFLKLSISSFFQQTFTLDLELKIFNFSLNSLNNSKLSEDLIFSGSENQTVWIRLPKNSTVFYSNISLEGIMKPLLTTTGLNIYKLEVGNVIPTNDFDEIAIVGPSYIKLLNNHGNEIWSFNVTGTAVSLGNLSSDEGNEIVVGTSNGYIYLFNSSGSLKFQKSIGFKINDIEVGNVIPTNDFDEIAIATGNGTYVLTSVGNQLWMYSGSFEGIGIGNLSSDEGNEIVVGTSNGYIYLFNSSGSLKFQKSIDVEINDIEVGNVIPTNDFDEIAIATINGTIFLLDFNGNILWSFDTFGSSVTTIRVAEVTSEYPGNEVIAGSEDNKVYVISASGQLIWSYLTQNIVKGLGIGNLSQDPGEEVVAGTMLPATYTLYILNFEYYPTNVSLDIGNDGEIEWYYSGKFRGKASVSNNSAFQKYLSNCEPDSTGNCDIPLVFHSDFAGDLNITSVYLEFEYNLSGIIFSSTINAWSRVVNIRANESVGNQTINISFTRNPALDLRINYIKVNDSATRCDFNNITYNVTTIGGKKYCNISSLNFLIPSSGSLPSAILWDDSMNVGVPIIINESEGRVIEAFWKKNITIWNTTPQIFYNITANTSIDESVVISQPKLKVFWNNNWYDITPSQSSNNCNSTNPTYQKITIGSDEFFVCKQDTNFNGIEDLFVWKQPHSSITLYEVSGSGNRPPILSNITVLPSKAIWGSEFNISLNVSDVENDNVTLQLWVNIKSLNVSQLIEEKNFTGNQSITFTFSTNKSWVGINEFWFNYTDFNSSSGIQLHDWIISSFYPGPNVTKRNASVIYIEGNDSRVNRSEATLLSVQLIDNFDSSPIPNANCSFWVWLNQTHNSSYFTKSDENGFCNYSFTPNSSYQPGQREWKAGVYSDSYYETNISSGFFVKIYGKLNIRLNSLSNFTRGISLLNASLFDEFNQPVKLSGYTCEWFINDTLENTTQTDSYGFCFHPWKTDCSNELGYYNINVTLSGNVNEFYYLNQTSQEILRALKDNLNITIISPLPNSIYHVGETILLNSTINDSCGLATYNYSVIWFGDGKTDPGLSTCSMSVEGENSSYNVASNCMPGIFLIKANASGELYNSDQKNVSVWIYGWSQVNFTFPLNESKVNKAEREMLDLVCQVKDPSSPVQELENYPVYFWDLTSGEEFLAQVKTNLTGYAKYSWNITNISDLAQVKCNISNTNITFYRYYNASVKESYITFSIIENDTKAPTIENLKAEPAILGESVKIEANVSDKYGVDKVWVNVSFPNSSFAIYYLQNKTSQITNTTWEVTIPGLNLGDYDFVLFANDTSNNIANATSWFEVYQPIQMYLNASFPIDFTFFRPGKEIIIHRFSYPPGNYNFTLHKRTYDWSIKIGENWIKIFNFNTTRTSELQFNSSDANLTNPINISLISVSLIDLPKPEKYKISAFEIKTNASYSNLLITFNYSKDLNEGRIWFEPGIKIFKCANWSYPNCYSGWVEVSSNLDLTNHLISTLQTSPSVYTAAEIEVCGNGKCGYGESCVNCPEDCGSCGPTYTPPAGGGGGAGAPSLPPETTPTEEIKFSIRTNLSEAQININETKYFALWILNEMSSRQNFTVSISGSITDLVKIERDFISVNPKTEGMLLIEAYAPPRTELGTYTGTIYVTTARKTQNLPVTLTVSLKGLIELDIMAEALTKQVNPDRVARFRIVLYNLGVKKNFDANFTFIVQNPETKEIIFSTSKIKSLQSSYESFIEEIYIPQNISLGQYLFVVEAEYDGKKKSSSDLFEVVQPFWTPARIQLATILLVALFSVFSFFYARSYYKKWRLKTARYIAPVKPGKLPRGELWLGKVAEIRAKATFAMDDLTTHVLVAGATGSGKSVTASLFVEELLEKKIPVVVFDPTAQWTGFVRPCKDPKILKYYRAFGLSPEEAKPFKGLIFEVTTPKVEIDFKKLMNPGEITIFTLDKLKPGQYDEAVTNIIDTIFAQGWEESSSLRLVIVFDEVHRLLEKYGGKGGYVALERACREFRKWGIGLIMVSQVLSDFKEAIKGNVLTEIQMHTKSLGDLARVEKKYGLEYAKRVARLEVGVGLIQNPKYNEGIPWFISFRPPLHMPHKIPEKELKMYKDFSKAIEEIERELEIIEKAGMDIFEFKTELKLAKDKLKQGSFRMAEIYITSLRKKLVDFWIGKYGEGKYRRK